MRGRDKLDQARPSFAPVVWRAGVSCHALPVIGLAKRALCRKSPIPLALHKVAQVGAGISLAECPAGAFLGLPPGMSVWHFARRRREVSFALEKAPVAVSVQGLALDDRQAKIEGLDAPKG